MIESFGRSDTGCVRSENEDRILTDHSLLLFVVCDGMGGHNHGEKAAELALSTLQFYLESSRDRFDVTWPFGYDYNLSIDANRIVTGIQLANRQVWRFAEQAPEFAGMGTTIAAILLSEGNAIVANVGDSRVYLFRAGELHLLTVDDTFVNSLLQRGGIEAIEIQAHPLKNVLTQAAGSQENLNVHVLEHRIADDDLFLVCSDGLHGVIGDEAIRSILGADRDLERTTGRLIDAARALGGPDNVSCVLMRYNH